MSSIAFEPMRFEYPDDFQVGWHSRVPEFAAAANGVSLLMPYVEPYVVRSVRQVTGSLEEPLRSEAQVYVRQEGQHHVQHRRFNDLVVAQVPALGFTEGLMARVYGWLSDKRSLTFGVAFAAGFETVAYAAARWTAERSDSILAGSDDRIANLFLWHLAEEVEHKNVAIDVFRAIGGKKRTYVAAMILSAVLLAIFSWLNTTLIMIRTRRFLHPLAHVRLLIWTISFLFELLPAMVVSVLPSHHPSDLADPLLLENFLKEHRPVTTAPDEVRPAEESTAESTEDRDQEPELVTEEAFGD